MVVRFTKEQIKKLDELAFDRNNKNDNVRSRKLGINNSDAHRLGVWSEAAVASLFGQEVNAEIFKDGGDKHAPDLVVPGVGNIEVKCVSSTYNSHPWLKVPVNTFNESVDYYVIVSSVNYTEGTVNVYGYSTKDEVKKAAQAKCIPTGPLNYIIKNGYHPIEDLIPNKSPAVEESNPNRIRMNIPFKKKEESTPKVTLTSAYTPSDVTYRNTYKPGDVVKLNSGGPNMSVVSIKKTAIKCVYFNNNNDAIELCLPEESLVKG